MHYGKIFLAITLMALLGGCEVPNDTARRDCTEAQVISDGITRTVSILAGHATFGGC